MECPKDEQEFLTWYRTLSPEQKEWAHRLCLCLQNMEAQQTAIRISRPKKPLLSFVRPPGADVVIFPGVGRNSSRKRRRKSKGDCQGAMC